MGRAIKRRFEGRPRRFRRLVSKMRSIFFGITLSALSSLRGEEFLRTDLLLQSFCRDGDADALLVGNSG